MNDDNRGEMSVSGNRHGTNNLYKPLGHSLQVALDFMAYVQVRERVGAYGICVSGETWRYKSNNISERKLKGN